MSQTASPPPPPPGSPAADDRRGLLRRGLDGLYLAGAWLSCLCFVGLLGVITAQMVTRWADIMFPGSTSYAGYLMAAASFFAFAYALNEGAHVRVSILLTALGKHRFWGEVFCLGLGSVITCYLAWHSIQLVRFSHKLNDLSQGQDATPLWIVQMPVAIGAVLLAVCFIDNLLTLIFTGTSPVASRDLESELHGE